MSGVRMLRFGPSGIPRSSARPGTEAGIRRVRELGLGCMEMAWGNGVRMGDATADRIAETAAECGIELTAHAPYFLNLCGEPEVARRSLRRLEDAARLAARCGARSLCFHAGYYPDSPRARPQAQVARRLASVLRALRDDGLAVDLRPELTGRPSQLGTMDEILDWCAGLPGVHPCIDFSHHYARHGGAYNDADDFAALLEAIRGRLGSGALRRLHVHLSGIEYGPRGERRHVPLRASRFRYREVLKVLKAFGVAGWVIGESPLLEDDALLLQRTYRRLP